MPDLIPPLVEWGLIECVFQLSVSGRVPPPFVEWGAPCPHRADQPGSSGAWGGSVCGKTPPEAAVPAGWCGKALRCSRGGWPGGDASLPPKAAPRCFRGGIRRNLENMGWYGIMLL